MTIDLALRRAELLRLRERILRAAADLAADDEGVGELSSAAGDQHIADHAIRSRRSGGRPVARRERRQRRSPRSTTLSGASRVGPTDCARSVARRSRRSGSRRSRTPPSASTTSDGRKRVERARTRRSAPSARRSRRLVDERPPADLERRAAARCRPLAVDRPRGDRGNRDRRGSADEVDRLAAAADRRRGRHDRPVQHPPRAEHRHRLRPLRRLDDGRDRADHDGRGRDARVLRTNRPAPPACSRSRSGS